jgi:hypothetical protein
MPGFLEKLVVLSLLASIFFSGLLPGALPHDLHLSFPISLQLSKNEVSQQHIDVETGVSLDWWLFNRGQFYLAPGLSLLGSMPRSGGNSVVVVKPYMINTEFRISGGYASFGPIQGILPFFSLGGQVGGLIVAKKVASQNSFGREFIYGAITSLGLAYFVNGHGLGFSYGLVIGKHAVRHKIELSLEFAWNTR